ncbi:DAK2 domain-containing protein [Streptomyces sp. NPDC002668]|uniref:DAK2 domain-containing protein n=1 Tax=Streptomyces sp. NPDC002668 TaxID=3154422 RepID=UPI00331D6559
MAALAEAFLNDVGGTSGPLFGLLFQDLATVSWSDDQAPDALAVADAAKASLDAIHRVGGAKVGDCTLVDALVPAVDALAPATASNRLARSVMKLSRPSATAYSANIMNAEASPGSPSWSASTACATSSRLMS